MKKLIPVLLFLLIGLFLASAYAASAYPESEHSYASNTDQTWEYNHPEPVDYLAVTFSEDTQTESGYDYIYIYTSADDQERYDGDELSGRTIYLPGSCFFIRLTSDGSVNKYGFSITSICGVTQAEYEQMAAWTVEDGVLTAYNGTAAELVIPPSVGGQAITEIGSGVFMSNETLVSVTVSEGVTSIGESAFEGCSNLADVSLPDGLASIGSWAFSSCESITCLSMPDTVTEVGYGVFNYCTGLTDISLSSSLEIIAESMFSCCTGLTSIDIPEGVTVIEDYVFEGCESLVSVSLPASLMGIGEYDFTGCSSLISIAVAGNNPVYLSVNGMVVTREGMSLAIIPPGTVNALVPSGVTAIGSGAFFGCENLVSVVMPNSVTAIGYMAFENCVNLSDITFSDTLETIGGYAFYGCSGLTSIHLPASVKVIGRGAFSFCESLTDIYYAGSKDNLEVYPHLSDEGADDITLHFADGSSQSLAACINIVDSGSCGSNLTWRLNGDGVLIISGAGAMDDYYLTTEYKYDAAGNRTSTKYYSYPWRYVMDRIAAVRVEEGVTTIGNMAFADIGTLKSACLPTSLTRVVYGAFNGTGLADVYYAGSEAQWSGVYKEQYNTALSNAAFHWNDTDMPLPDIIYWSYSGGLLTVSGRGEMKNYSKWSSTTTYGSGEVVYSEYVDYPWKSVAGEITSVRVKEGVTVIGQNCFARMDALVNVELPRSLVTIKSGAFSENDLLETMNIPSGVSAIEDEVFYGCTALQNINVSGDNPSLKSVDGVLFTKNGEELLFYPAGRTQTSYAVPAGVEIIQAYAFAGCESLLQIDLPESLWRISYYAFENTGLRYVIIPQGVEHINSQAFACCRSLTYAVIPAGLTYLGYDVFLDCPLQRVDFGGSEEEWNALIDPETGSYNEELENAAVSFNSGYIPAENPLIMPADLAVIEDAAFEGGAFTHVYLNAGVVSIGSRAFANCPHLRCVSILNADVSIASDAFDGSYFVVIVCAEGSSAHQFAIEHGIAYQIIGAAD